MTQCLRAVLSALAVGVLAATAVSHLASAKVLKDRPLTGRLLISGKTAIDPPKKAAGRTHAFVTVVGVAAQDLYKAMKGKERADACRGNGWKMKTAGNLMCSRSRDGKRATCDFGLRLASGSTAPGRPC